MFYTTKVQTEMLKILAEGDEHKRRKAAGCIHEGAAYVTADTLVAYRIPEAQFFLDISKINNAPVHRFFKSVETCYKLTHKEKRFFMTQKGKEQVVHIFTDETGAEHMVNADFLKPFEKMGCEVWATACKANAAVILTANGVQVALVMPINPERGRKV